MSRKYEPGVSGTIGEVLTAGHAPASAGLLQSPQQVKEDAKPLFTSFKIGKFQLQHRVIMAPLTRCRYTVCCASSCLLLSLQYCI
jgi:hypothetical protein